MSFPRVINVVFLIQIFIGLAMLATAGVAFFFDDGDSWGILYSGVITLVVAGVLYRTTTFEGDITSREGFAIVTLAWVATASFGALPYLLTETLESPMAAFFEAMSGFTTTGATVFSDIERLPHGVLFWRSLTQWLGGMGIIVLVMAVISFFSVSGMQLFRAEVPGPEPQRLKPRITQTAKLLWFVYVGLTATQAVLYLFGGMSLFDSLTHSFTTLATGGFSTKNASFAAFNSPYIQWVTILFMYLAGVNFFLHYRAAVGKPMYGRDHEWRFFTGLLVLSGLIIAAFNLGSGASSGVEPAIRAAFFQVTAIVTTTGFVSADYELWAPGLQVILLALFFVGGMAGSTGGGIKAMRILLLFKQVANELKKHLHPRAIFVTRIGETPVKQEVIGTVTGFVILYLFLCLAGAILLAFMGMDLLCRERTT